MLALDVRPARHYRGGDAELRLRRDLLPSTAKALFLDDWINTGGQAVTARKSST